MEHSPPDDADPASLATFHAVNRDREQLGLLPYQYTEFVSFTGLLRGAREYWTPDKLRAKAQRQLRNPKTKRWMKERGRVQTPIHRTARARVDTPTTDTEPTDDVRTLTNRTRGRNGFKIPRRPAGSPTVKVTRLTGDAMIEALREAQPDKDAQHRLIEKETAAYKDRGVLFKVDEPGQNPVFVFFAHPDGMIKHRMAPHNNNVRQHQNNLKQFQQQAAKQLKARNPGAIRELQYLQNELDNAMRRREQQLGIARNYYGSGGDETIGAAEEDVASEAAALFLAATKNWPPYRRLSEDGTPFTFLLSFDESKLVNGEGNDATTTTSITDTVHGRATGKFRINFDLMTFRETVSAQDKDWLMPVEPGTTWGQHAAAHEPGHLLDYRNGPWDSNTPIFDDYIAQSRGIVDAEYLNTANRANREWFAEMSALMQRDQAKLRPSHQLAVMAYQNMFMLQHPSRPDGPTPAWIEAHQQWLRTAQSAVRNGRRPPPLPDPRKFFASIPEPRIYKNPKWKLPW